MRIVFVLRSLANRGGIERVLTDKANFLAEHGHQVLFVTYEQGMHKHEFYLCPNIQYFDLDCRKFTIYRYSLLKRLFENWKMNRLMKARWNTFVDNNKPDVVVITTYSDDFMSEFMSVNKKTHIIVESHTAFTHDMCPSNCFNYFRKRILLNTLKRCDLLITLSDGDKQCWGKHIKNVRKVINPVTHYVDNVENCIRKKGRIICVGRLHEQKRFDRIINAFALITNKYPDWYIDIYGKGYLQDDLKRLIVDLGLERKIVIHEPTSNIYQEYLQSELFVLSSDYEGMPLALLEAMACGVPSLATDCPFGPSEVIEDYKTGLLSKMDEKDLAHKIEWMITHEKERHMIGVKGHQIAAKFKKDIVMKEWEDAYLSVL